MWELKDAVREAPSFMEWAQENKVIMQCKAQTLGRSNWCSENKKRRALWRNDQEGQSQGQIR
jgi:hypothetical protein